MMCVAGVNAFVASQRAESELLPWVCLVVVIVLAVAVLIDAIRR
jgi:hypothetical protein